MRWDCGLFKSCFPDKPKGFRVLDADTDIDDNVFYEDGTKREQKQVNLLPGVAATDPLIQKDGDNDQGAGDNQDGNYQGGGMTPNGGGDA